MAASCLLIFSLTLFQALLIGPSSEEYFPTAATIKQWVDKMQNDLVTLARTASGVDQLAEIYTKNKNLYTVEANNARQLVESAATNIEKLLRNRSKALEHLAEKAEEIQGLHQWRDDFGSEKTDNDSLSQRIKPVFNDDPVFRRQTSYQHSAVHIPTDIYEGSTIVLNELNWTAALDEVFKKNSAEDKTLLWQVFGSATGLARYYPASPWVDKSRTPNKIDLYDVRRRPWYIQGAASPKDMLILVDVSGSVSGLTLKLIRTSVTEMLETLSDDDFVNVAAFNSNAHDVSCFHHLVQANVRNKKVLKEAVNNITAKGTTDYKQGFKFAFDQLRNTNVSRANCNKIIMLFTDGGEDKATETFKLYNKNKTVRVFTFSVGQHNYDKGPIQWMACENKGYYYEIPSIGAIRINTQEYLDVLGRPMVLAREKAKQVQWTNVYLDALELGLVITGTLPVFNLTGDRKENKNQLILGVMGVDVSLKDIQRLTPRFTLCPNGYYFALDPNGYVLLHPNLQPKPIGLGIPMVNLRKRRPDFQNPKSQEPVTLDFLDAELENEHKVEIRTKMIDGENGERTFQTLVKSQDERYIDKANRTYTWGPVNGTDYSLALVLPSYSFYYIKAKLEDTMTQAKSKKSRMKDSETLKPEQFDEAGATYLAPREYCTDLPISSNNTEFLVNFNNYIDTRTPSYKECNKELINRALLDAGLSYDLVQNHWKGPLPNGVTARFVSTDGGITRVYPKSAGEYWFEDPETYEDSFYKRSLDNDNYIFTAPFFNRTGMPSYESGIMVSKAVEITIEGKLLKPAVVGVKINFENWKTNFTNATAKESCKIDEVCSCELDSSQLDCVILDDGGFLLMSNQQSYNLQIGKFFGEIDPSLMKKLVNISVYAFNKSYDYQSVCDPGEEPAKTAAPRSVFVPTIADILNLGWWASAAAWSILQQLLWSLTLPHFNEAAEFDDDDFSSIMSKQSCITEQTQYFFENDNRSFSGYLDCVNCTRIYHVEKLVNTNLLFIIVDSHRTCDACDQQPLIQAEQRSNGPDPCLLAQNPRYRKGPDVCFDQDELEDDGDCGGVSGLTPSLWSMIGIQFVLLWLLSGSKHCQL
ncbi:voltage-dependent calcium channel subunit alpha-2/delta-1 isoform X4 [Lithobates pipiens]